MLQIVRSFLFAILMAIVLMNPAHAQWRSAYPSYVSGSGAGGGGGSSTTPGGATTQIQYNNNGVFAGDPSLTYVSSTAQLTLGTNAPGTDAQVGVTGMVKSYYLPGNALGSGFRVVSGTNALNTRMATLDVGNTPNAGRLVLYTSDTLGAMALSPTPGADSYLSGYRRFALGINNNGTLPTTAELFFVTQPGANILVSSTNFNISTSLMTVSAPISSTGLTVTAGGAISASVINGNNGNLRISQNGASINFLSNVIEYGGLMRYVGSLGFQIANSVANNINTPIYAFRDAPFVGIGGNVNTTSGILSLITSNTARITVADNGGVVVGTGTNSAALLDVYGDVSSSATVRAASGSFANNSINAYNAFGSGQLTGTNFRLGQVGGGAYSYISVPLTLGRSSPGPSSTLDVSGSIKFTGVNITCDGGSLNTVRMVTTLKTIAFCDGTNWIALASTTTVVPAATN